MAQNTLRLLILLSAFPLFLHAQVERDLWDFDPAIVQGHEEGPDRNDIVAGEFFIDPPTFENLGFRWFVEGDRNGNATVTVDYREVGQHEWRQAQPMMRINHEIVTRYTVRHPNHPHREDAPNFYRTDNLFAGSVLFLQPGTDYEVRFIMHDPDGGAPAEPKIVTVATRSEPAHFEGERILHVYPPDFSGNRSATLSFSSIAAAIEAVQPGDVVLFHPGIHPASDAPYTINTSGQPGRPIVFRGAGAGLSIIEGPDRETDLFHIAGADHLMFEDLAMRRLHTAIHTAPGRAAGRHPHDRGGIGASWLTVRRCHISDAINGIWTMSRRSHNWTITDNFIHGVDSHWFPRTPRPEGPMGNSHTGVNVYGSGHVVAYNRISHFSDSLAIANIALPETDDRSLLAVNIDFYNNDLSDAVDDTIEADYGCHNIRVYRNLCYNTHTALSIQPAYGGPIFLIRNEAYAISVLNLKWNNIPGGPIAYHNTLVTNGVAFGSPPWINGRVKNNLLLGNSRIIRTGTVTPETSQMDYNGYRGNPFVSPQIRWYQGRQGELDFETLAEFAAATGFEQHGIMIDFDSFVAARLPERGKSYSPDEWDLRLKADSPARNAGTPLANINDGFSGTAPDLGAFEYGTQRPHYGPRIQGQ